MDRPHQSSPSDPHRRLQRHTYQEGPGFLFLATRGGRPPAPGVREDLTGLRFRICCVRTALTEGIAAALALGVSRTSLFRWRQRYAKGGIEALRQQPRGPARDRLPAWVERAVIVVRLLTYWNSKRLAAEFSRRGIYPPEPPRRRCRHGRAGHGPTLDLAGTWPGLRAEPSWRWPDRRHRAAAVSRGSTMRCSLPSAGDPVRRYQRHPRPHRP